MKGKHYVFTRMDDGYEVENILVTTYDDGRVTCAVKHPESRGFREPPLELSSTEEFTTEPIRDHPFFWPDRGATPEGGIWECTFPGCGLPVVEHDYFVVDNDGGHDDPWSCTVAPITALTRVADPTNEE